MESNPQILRQQLDDLEKLRLKAARRCVVGFGAASILALLGFVYGYVQQAESTRVHDDARKEMQEALMLRDKAEQQVAEAKQAMLKLEALTIELEICRASARK